MKRPLMRRPKVPAGWWPLLIVCLGGFVLRFWRLDSVPPGWRDDELINVLVMSQKILDGQWTVYFPDASGHEFLYHALVAGMVALFGHNALGIRGVSAILGLLTLPLTYLMARRLFNRQVGIIAAAGLTLSFWSLMYSRVGIRHVSTVVFTLAAFYFFFKGLGMAGGGEAPVPASPARMRRYFAAAGGLMGVGFYTYFAARGVPLILLAFCLYLLLFHRPLLLGRWRGIALMFGVAAVLALPLVLALRAQPEAEARVSELAAPLTAARDGDYSLIAEHVVRTLNMTHADGDGEWLYNIPGRPLFGPIGAIFFWAGVVSAAWYAVVQPLRRRLWPSHEEANPGDPRPLPGSSLASSSAFLLIWWLAGISPGFISVPPASLGHTILAQPAVYLLAALPLLPIGRWWQARQARTGQSSSGGRNALPWPVVVLAALLLASIARRDLPDYFDFWPQRGIIRFLYRAEIRDLADYLNHHPEYTDFAVAGLLAGPWDRLALELDLDRGGATRPRWYDPERAIMLEIGGEPALSFGGYPKGSVLYESAYRPLESETAGAYQLAVVTMEDGPDGEEVCFQDGLCSVGADYDAAAGILDLTWAVARPLDLPPMPLISNPPPPGVYAGPRLSVFSQILDEAGNFVTGDDGLWVDVTTLHPGDVFLQQHRLVVAAGTEAATAAFGLYDPLTGERILTTDGRDTLRLTIQP